MNPRERGHKRLAGTDVMRRTGTQITNFVPDNPCITSICAWVWGVKFYFASSIYPLQSMTHTNSRGYMKVGSYSHVNV